RTLRQAGGTPGCAVNDVVPRGLVPPRPNLPPEPWPEPLPILGVLVALALLAVLMLAGLLWRRHRLAARAQQGHLVPAAGSDSEASPCDRLVALAESVRDALTGQFGAGCR